MGAAERRRWSSLVRTEDAATAITHLARPELHGVAIFGPAGVGKTTLARRVATDLATSHHVVRLFGSAHDPDTPYGVFGVQMARLTENQTGSPLSILQGLLGLLRHDAAGRPILIVLDDLPGIDTASVGVLIQLVLGKMAKLLVSARSIFDLPDDLAVLVKDALLTTQRLEAFDRQEVRQLLRLGLEGAVAESVVAAVMAASAGNPQVLQALVNEYVHSGQLRRQDEIWVLSDEVSDAAPETSLAELLDVRLARESATVCEALEKFSLLRTATLSVAMRALGSEVVVELEERGYLAIHAGGNGTTTLAEPYIGDILRARLTPAQKVRYFEQMASVLSLDPMTMSTQQLLTFAAWIIDAGLVLRPAVAVAAGRAALDYFDPQRALRYCADVPADHALAVQAVQIRSRVYYMMANYPKAVATLEAVDADTLAAMSTAEHADFVLDLTASLIWVRDGYARITTLHEAMQQRLRADTAAGLDTAAAQRAMNLAHFEFHVHRGSLQVVLAELERDSQAPGDREYRLNCASLLVPVYATMGRELDAIALAHRITEEVREHELVLSMGDWNVYGLFQALIWSGQWRACEAYLQEAAELPVGFTHFRGGILELTLGAAYTFAGRGFEAVDALLVAAAQLEIRETHNSSAFVHSALAFAFAQGSDSDNAHKHLLLAAAPAAPASWMQNATAEFFRLMALSWLSDPGATPQLLANAERDLGQGRVTTASISLMGATTYGSKEQYRLLLASSLQRQGAMPAISVALSRAHLEGNAALALEAASAAHALELTTVESRCALAAADLAGAAGEMRLLRDAQLLLEELRPKVPRIAGIPTHSTVPLTARERQVATLAMRGMANKDIADRIGVSVRTVEGHLYQVFAKLGITSRAELERGVNL